MQKIRKISISGYHMLRLTPNRNTTTITMKLHNFLRSWDDFQKLVITNVFKTIPEKAKSTYVNNAQEY